ncbi:MAG: 30S ribosomal protein S16 [Candidatus Omnitrophica bacterium]|nr:30S ribosomal protein S16 [Candidatus Omnitrophota bacterium]
MAVVIRLKRIGSNKKAAFRIVVTDSRNPRDGRNVEEIGSYDPRQDPPYIKVDKKRVDYWIGVGATPSPTVKSLLKTSKAI